MAQLITFVDWTMVKKKGKKQKQLLSQAFNTLEELEDNLREIRTIVEEKRTITSSAMKDYVDLLSDVKSELVKSLFNMGIEVPEEKPPKVEETSERALLATVNLGEKQVIQAKNFLLRKKYSLDAGAKCAGLDDAAREVLRRSVRGE